MNKLYNFCLNGFQAWQRVLIFGVSLVLLFTLVSFPQVTLASSLEITPQEAEKAAEQIVQEDQKVEAKNRYNQKGSGSELIDKARSHARKKLKTLVNESTDSENPEKLKVLQQTRK